jgi:hypothetical protein
MDTEDDFNLAQVPPREERNTHLGTRHGYVRFGT